MIDSKEVRSIRFFSFLDSTNNNRESLEYIPPDISNDDRQDSDVNL